MFVQIVEEELEVADEFEMGLAINFVRNLASLEAMIGESGLKKVRARHFTKWLTRPPSNLAKKLLFAVGFELE